MSDTKLSIDEQYAEIRFDFDEAFGMFIIGCQLGEPVLIEMAVCNLLGETCPYEPDNALRMTMLFTEKQAELFLANEGKAKELMESHRNPATEQCLIYLADIVERIHEQPAFHP